MQVDVLNSQFAIILILEKDGISRKFNKSNFERGTLSNLWQIKRDPAIKGHGATFPKQLIKTILENFSNKGDVILDPFMGTGTTGVVCKELDRNFIGIELMLKYLNIAKDRIDSVISL